MADETHDSDQAEPHDPMKPVFPVGLRSSVPPTIPLRTDRELDTVRTGSADVSYHAPTISDATSDGAPSPTTGHPNDRFPSRSMSKTTLIGILKVISSVLGVALTGIFGVSTDPETGALVISAGASVWAVVGLAIRELLSAWQASLSADAVATK